MLENLIHGKSNKRLRMMLEAIRTRDFSLQYSTENLRGEEKALAMEINSVLNEFRDTMLEQESQYQYFDTLLNTVSDFMIVADEDHNVRWMNRAAIEGLCGFRIRHINELAAVSEKLPGQLLELNTGSQQLIKLKPRNGNVEMDYAASARIFFSKGIMLKLYSLQNIRIVVQKSEAEAQQKLVRVLTHEIMNSLTPIISLADTLCDQIEQGGLDGDDTLMALRAIHRRGSGLLSFVENYRQLQKISQPSKADITVGELINGIMKLYGNPNIRTEIENADTIINIDRAQMEQVIINLLKNATEACENSGREAQIAICAQSQNNGKEICISVSDNGNGILPEVMDRIFVPFFTTKTSGSGIGLSLCKQIVSLHGGSIGASSNPGQGTTFSIVLTV